VYWTLSFAFTFTKPPRPTHLFEDEAGIKRQTAVMQCSVDNLKLSRGKITPGLVQPFAYQTDTDFMAQRRNLDETTHADDITSACQRVTVLHTNKNRKQHADATYSNAKQMQ